MKNRKRIWITGVILSALILGGCAKTPEESLVKQKGKNSLKNYEEAGTEEGLTEAGAGSGESAAKEETDAVSENKIRKSVNAPESYKSEVKDETGKLTITTDAVVEIPNAERASAINVSQHPFDQEVMDRITEVFFKDAAIYSADSLSQMTKADYQKKIEELKGYLAEGNMDPYGYGTDEAGNYYMDLYQMIEEAEQAYQNAPEKVTPVEVHPQFGLTNADGTVMDEYFFGVAKMTDGSEYQYIMKSYSSMPMEVSIRRTREKEAGTTALWGAYSASEEGDGTSEEEKEMETKIGISLEEAVEIAEEKVKALDIPNMELTAWEYGIYWEDNFDTGDMFQKDEGYMLHYTRVLNEFPITYTMDIGGALEDMDSEMETWGYETLDIIISEEGIEEVNIYNLYDIGDVKTENVNLMSFDEIMNIYEKMMVIKNADVLNYEKERSYAIDRITLGYSRIYEPSSDSSTGLLVPVWDFFGTMKTVSEYEGETMEYDGGMTYQSYLTINAIDGSVIDRGLGY